MGSVSVHALVGLIGRMAGWREGPEATLVLALDLIILVSAIIATRTVTAASSSALRPLPVEASATTPASQRSASLVKLSTPIEGETLSEVVRAASVRLGHEVRTPLGAILGFSELLRDANLPDATRRRFVDAIHRNAGELLALVDDLRDRTPRPDSDDSIASAAASSLELREEPCENGLRVARPEEKVPMEFQELECRSVYDDDPFMAPLIKQFLEKVPERLAALRLAISERDNDRVNRLAHQLKGSLYGYGFAAFGDCLAEVETLARMGRIDDSLCELVDRVDRAVPRSGEGELNPAGTSA